MNPIRMNAGGRPVLVLRPESAVPGPLSVDLLAAFNRARGEGASVCVVPSRDAEDAPLLSIVPAGVAVMDSGGATGAWLRTRSAAAAAATRTRRLLRDASVTLSQEWYRELRRHAGDERLPSDLRVHLREKAHRSLARSAARAGAVSPFPRRLLRTRVPVTLSPARLADAVGAARSAGIDPDRPIVAVEGRRRPDTFTAAIAWLLRQGYGVVRIGESAHESAQPGAIDLSSSRDRTPLLELFVMMNARFVVCESVDLQHVAYLTNTPSLLVNAREPFRAYPVCDDSLFTLSTPVDLDTGETLVAGDLLQERYVRNLRNYGFRDNSAAQVFAAVQEMHDGVTRGWSESRDQTRFRDLVTTAGVAMAPAVPYVAQWGPDAGFIGDGRLAAWQADSLGV